MTLTHTIACKEGAHATLTLDDMGEGTVIMTSDEGSLCVNVTQLQAVVQALASRYPIAAQKH